MGELHTDLVLAACRRANPHEDQIIFNSDHFDLTARVGRQLRSYHLAPIILRAAGDVMREVKQH